MVIGLGTLRGAVMISEDDYKSWEIAELEIALIDDADMCASYEESCSNVDNYYKCFHCGDIKIKLGGYCPFIH